MCVVEFSPLQLEDLELQTGLVLPPRILSMQAKTSEFINFLDIQLAITQ